jgi:hypothetical protein
MCKIVTPNGMEEIGDPRNMPQYGYSVALEAEHDPHWDPNEIQTKDMEHKYLLVVKGLPVKISAEEEVVVLKGRVNRGEHL